MLAKYTQANMSLSLINMYEKFRYYHLSFLLLTVLPMIFLYIWLISTKNMKMPPSPPKLPIIGHLHLLGKLPHRSLAKLSQKYGDLMLLYLGNRPTIIVSCASVAEEIMKTHDLTFANKAKLRFIQKLFYDGNDVAFASYSERWRRVKSICVLQLLSNKRVYSSRSIREEEVGQLIQEIKSYKGSVINLSEALLVFFKGLICRSALGKKYTGNDKNSKSLYNIMNELMEMMVQISVGDYVPYLGWVDKLTGLERGFERVGKQLDSFMEEVIQEHEVELNANQVCIIDGNDDKGQKVKDFVDVLLQVQRDNPNELSRDNIKAVLLDIYLAGIATSATTVEWAMTELVRHPMIMKRLQEEIRSVVKPNTRVITEDDIENMTYLKAVLKETLRLHAPVPLFLYRESSQNVKLDKYDISARTQVIINTWAIHRDPRYWQDPEAFNPQRFLDNKSPCFDFRGQNFNYIPFGAGRRACPAATYSTVNIELLLASFVYEFTWKLPDAREGETLDIEERFGMAGGRQNPLMLNAIPTLPSISLRLN